MDQIQSQETEFKNIIHTNLKYFRRSQKLSLRMLSARTRYYGHPLDKSTLSRIERGTRQVYDRDLQVLCHALHVSYKSMLDHKEPSTGRF